MFGWFSISVNPSCFWWGNFLPLKCKNYLDCVPLKIAFINKYLNIKHFPCFSPNMSIGAVRRHRFSSAGCCKIIILELECKGIFGNPGHQQTPTGLLQEIIMENNFKFEFSGCQFFIYLHVEHLSLISGGSAGIPDSSSQTDSSFAIVNLCLNFF